MYRALLLVAVAFLIQITSGAVIDVAYDGFAGPCAAAPMRAAASWSNAAYAAPLAAAPHAATWADGLWAAAPLAADATALAAGFKAYSPETLTASNGGGLLVTSSSPITPTGVSFVSENNIEGLLSVAGEMPFLGTVGLEGALPSVGSGSVAYGCGDGSVAIIDEEFNSYAAPAYGYDAYGYDVYGYDAYGYDAYSYNAYGNNAYGNNAYGNNAYGNNAYGNNGYGGCGCRF